MTTHILGFNDQGDVLELNNYVRLGSPEHRPEADLSIVPRAGIEQCTEYCRAALRFQDGQHSDDAAGEHVFSTGAGLSACFRFEQGRTRSYRRGRLRRPVGPAFCGGATKTSTRSIMRST